MGVHIPPNYALLRLKWQIAGDNRLQISTLGLVCSQTLNEQDVLSEAYAEFRAAFPASVMADSATLVGAELSYRDVGNNLATVEDNTQQAGSWAVTFLPTNCSLPVRKKTALGGRKNRGRMFLPACYLRELDVDHNGVLTPTFKDAVQARLDAWFVALTSEGLFESSPVVLHSDELLTPTPITNFQVGDRIFSTPNRMNN